MIKILVIENCRFIREEIMLWLTFEDFDVIGAEDSETGLEIALHEMPDLIISELTMRELNGFQLFTAIRFRHLPIPMILLTASTEVSAVIRSIEPGIDGLVTKPFSHNDLLSIVRSVLAKKQRQQATNQTRDQEFATL